MKIFMAAINYDKIWCCQSCFQQNVLDGVWAAGYTFFQWHLRAGNFGAQIVIILDHNSQSFSVR